MVLSGCTAGMYPQGEEFQLQWVFQEENSTAEYTSYNNQLIRLQDGRYEIINHNKDRIAVLGSYDEVRNLDGILQCINGEDAWFESELTGPLDYFTINGVKLDATLFSNTLSSQKRVNALSPEKGEDQMYGYINTQNLWVINPTLFSADVFSEGLAVVSWADGAKEGFINTKGEKKQLSLSGIPNEEGFQDGNLLLQLGNSSEQETVSTYLTANNTVLPSSEQSENVRYPDYYYEGARNFSEGLAAVQMNGLWGYIDTQGDVAIQPTYQSAYSFQNGVAVVTNEENEVALLNKQGDVVEPFFKIKKGYTFAGEYYDGVYAVKTGDALWNLVRNEGKPLLKKDVKHIYSSYQDWVWKIATRISTSISAKDEYLLYFTAADKERILTGFPLYDLGVKEYNHYGDTLMVHHTSKSYLYSISTGKELCSAWTIYPFHEGVARVQKKSGMYGFIDVTGEWVIPPVLTDASDFANGLAFARQGTTSGLIANPLLYETGWTQDELTRAQMLGLVSSDATVLSEEQITYGNFISIIKDMLNLQAIWEEKLYSDFRSDFHLTEKQIFSLCGITLDQRNQTIDQQNAAKILAEISRYYGNVVDFFYYPYATEVSDEYKDAIAYCSSLNLFSENSADQDSFAAEKPITQEEAAVIVLRLMEGIQ